MVIDEKQVKKIAKLARIYLTDQEIEMMKDQVSTILSWAEQLDEVDTSHIDPLFSVNLSHMPQRPDTIDHPITLENILHNAPEKGLGMFVVPKVVE